MRLPGAFPVPALRWLCPCLSRLACPALGFLRPLVILQVGFFFNLPVEIILDPPQELFLIKCNERDAKPSACYPKDLNYFLDRQEVAFNRTRIPTLENAHHSSKSGLLH